MDGDETSLSRVYVAIGDCEWKLDRPAEAFRAFNKAAELDPTNTAAQLQLAKLFVSGGAPERALIAAEIVLSQDPGNLDAMLAAGSAAADEGRTRDALERLTEVLRRDPSRTDAAILLSGVYSDLGRPAEARATLNSAIARAPNDPTAVLALGRLEEQEGHVEAAEAAYRAAVSRRDNAETEMRLAQFLTRSARASEAEALLQKVDALRPEQPWSLADFQLRSGRPQLAAQGYLSAVTGTKDKQTRAAGVARSIEALLAAASAGDQNQHRESLRKAREVLAANQSILMPLDTQILQAEIDLASGDLEAAATTAETALHGTPHSSPARYILGVTLHRLGKPLAARQQWQRAMEHDEEFIPVRLALADDALASGDYLAAERLVAPVVRQEPENLVALHTFCRALIAQKQYDSAHAIATRAAAFQKESPQPHVLLGDIALAANRPGSALLHYQQALLLSPDWSPAMEGLVRAYQRGNVTRSMIRRIEHAGSAAPASATLLELAGRLFAIRGWTEDARRCFQKSLNVDAGRKSAAHELAKLSGAAPALSAADGESSQALLDALTAQDKGRHKTAIAGYEEALRSGDKTGVAANNLAWLYAQTGGDLERALQLAMRARDAQPQNPAVSDTLGYVLLKRREYSRAVDVLEHAGELARFQKDPDPAVTSAIRAHLAEAYRKSGETDKANVVSRSDVTTWPLSRE